MYLEKCFVDLGFGPKERFPVAKELGETSIALLTDPTIDEETAKRNGAVLRRVVEAATRDVRAKSAVGA
jgi:dTDP-4-amino-4,6-dideoxygalactose transaminase